MGFRLFGTFIPYYGTCILIGIACAFLIGFYLCKKLSLNTDDFMIICAYLVAFGFTGAKILYILVSLKYINWAFVFQSMKNFNAFIGSGFVFFGGLIGGLLAMPFIKKVHKIDVYSYLKCLTPALGVAHCFGRIGCSLAGCCHGRPTTGNFYFIYTESIAAPNGVKLFPIQGIEAFSVLCIAIVCFILVIKKKDIKVHYLYISIYSVVRFILEFYRADSVRGFAAGLSTSQIISISLLLIIICLEIYERFIRKKKIVKTEEITEQENI